jgi:hypothetical protein
MALGLFLIVFLPVRVGRTVVAASISCPSLAETATGTPTTDVDAAYISSLVGGVTSCGTIASTIGSEAGTTSGVDDTVPQRPAREQFSTRELVALYHRIISEQIIVRQQVRVQYGTNFSELWFPAAIHLQNADADAHVTNYIARLGRVGSRHVQKTSESKLIAMTIATKMMTTTRRGPRR